MTEPEFDQYAHDYASLLRDPIRDRFSRDSIFFYQRKWRLLKEFLNRAGFDAATSAWLDIGCGAGQLLQLGQAAFREVSGCDPSAGMLHAGCSGIPVECQPDPLVLPYAAARFDLVTAVCVYHHVSDADRPALTAEAFRVLSPGGIFAIMEHNPFNPVTRLIVSRTPVDANAHLLPARTARKIVTATGFRVLETVYFLYFPERLYDRLAAAESLLSTIPAGGQYAIFATKPQ